MKKVLLACLFMFSCTLIPASANEVVGQVNTDQIIYTNDGVPIINIDELRTPNVDLSDGLIADHSAQPFAYGDVIYNMNYLTVPARKSVNLGLVHFGFSGDRVLIEWDGATQSNPQMDIVVEYEDGSQYSLYEAKGTLLTSNSGSIILQSSGSGYTHIWFRSLNYSDVVFYRVTLADGYK